MSLSFIKRCNVFQPVRVEYGYYIELLLTTWNCTESSTHFSVTQSVDLEETTIKYESSLGFNRSQIQMHTYWFSPGSLNSPTTTEATRAVFATEPPWGGGALENGNRLNLRRWATWFSSEGKCWTGELIYLHWESAVEAHLWGLCIPQKHTQSPHLRRINYECVKLWKFDITTHLWKVQTWKLRQSWFSPLACCEPDSFQSDHRVDDFNWFPSLM